MAKVYDSDVDPDEFIRDFRQEPSGIGGLKKAPAVKDDATSTPISEQPKEKLFPIDRNVMSVKKLMTETRLIAGDFFLTRHICGRRKSFSRWR